MMKLLIILNYFIDNLLEQFSLVIKVVMVIMIDG